MSVVDISQGFTHISPQELINYAERGVLFAGMVDLSGFVEYIISEQDLAEYNRGYQDAEDKFDRKFCDEFGEWM